MIIQTIESERGDDELMVSVLRVTTGSAPAGDAVRLRLWPEVVVEIGEEISGEIIRGFNATLESGLLANPMFGGGHQRIDWSIMGTNDSAKTFGVFVDGKLKFSDVGLRKLGLAGQMLAKQMFTDALEAMSRMEKRTLKRGESVDEWKIDTVIERRKRKSAAERAMARKAARKIWIRGSGR